MRWSRPNTTKRLRWHRAIHTGVPATTHRVCAFTGPGPSPWRYAQDWAQRSVDRPEGSPLPAYEEALGAQGFIFFPREEAKWQPPDVPDVMLHETVVPLGPGMLP